MSDAHTEPDPATSETTEATPSHDLPDLGAVQARIDEAHQAEDHLVQVMPGAIDPDEGDDESRVQTEGGAKDPEASED